MLGKIKLIHSQSSTLNDNLSIVKRMASTARPAFASSLSDELVKATSQVHQVREMLSVGNASHSVIHEQMCSAAYLVHKVHSSIVEHSKDVHVAREAKATAISHLDTQSELYDSACHELEAFVGWVDSVVAQVSSFATCD